jgi:phage shock protein A
MTEQEAIKKGYSYTGIWERSWEKDKVKARAKELRQQGNKAVMIPRGTGISVYWIESPANKAARKLEQAERDVACVRNSLEQAKYVVEQCQKELASAEERLQLARIEVIDC